MIFKLYEHAAACLTNMFNSYITEEYAEPRND